MRSTRPGARSSTWATTTGRPGFGAYSRRLLLERGDTVQAANALSLLASIDGYRGDNQAALGKFTEARGVFEAANDQDKLAMVLANEGLIHATNRGDLQQALADAGRALGLYREMNFKPGIINELSNTGQHLRGPRG